MTLEATTEGQATENVEELRAERDFLLKDQARVAADMAALQRENERLRSRKKRANTAATIGEVAAKRLVGDLVRVTDRVSELQAVADELGDDGIEWLVSELNRELWEIRRDYGVNAAEFDVEYVDPKEAAS